MGSDFSRSYHAERIGIFFLFFKQKFILKSIFSLISYRSTALCASSISGPFYGPVWTQKKHVLMPHLLLLLHYMAAIIGNFQLRGFDSSPPLTSAALIELMLLILELTGQRHACDTSSWIHTACWNCMGFFECILRRTASQKQRKASAGGVIACMQNTAHLAMIGICNQEAFSHKKKKKKKLSGLLITISKTKFRLE